MAISNVLVPLDGSVLAEQALPTATSLVRRRQGRLELVLVRHKRLPPGFEDWPWVVSTPAMGEQYVAAKAREWSDVLGGAVGHASVDGDVAGQICKRAAEVHADLIVMSTHARRGLQRLFTGSIADAVIRRSRTPVLLLREPDTWRRLRGTALHFPRILITIDGSARSRDVFPSVAGLVERGVTEIFLLQVAGLDTTREATDAIERELTDAAADLAHLCGCDVFPHIIVDDQPARAIVRFSRRFNASLIAMTTHGRGASRLVLGSVVDSVLREAGAPMLVFRPPAQ